MSTPLLEQHVDDLLSRRWPGAADDFVNRVQELIQLAYGNADSKVIEEVSRRFRWAFLLDDDTPTVTRRQAPFDALVPKGWFHEYLRWTQEHEAPAPFHFGAVLTFLSASFARRPRFVWQARPTYPNLYCLLVGPSGARKGSAIGHAQRLVTGVRDVNVLGCDGTYQGYAAALLRRFDATGVADGLILVPELTTAVREDKNKKGMIDTFTEWYDCNDRYERELASNELFRFGNVYVTFIGASNKAWLRKLPADAAAGGWLPRHLVFCADEPRHRKWSPVFDGAIERSLAEGLARIPTQLPDEVSFTPDTGRYMQQWYEKEMPIEYRRTSDEQLRAWMDRKQAAVMKMAYIWQVVDGGGVNTLEVDWVLRARRMVDWMDTGVREVYSSLGTTEDGEVIETVRSTVARRGKIRDAELKKLLWRRWRAARVSEALQTLHASGEIKRTVRAREGITWLAKTYVEDEDD